MEELNLEWSPPTKPERSKLDKWFLQPGRSLGVGPQRPAPFFPTMRSLMGSLDVLDRHLWLTLTDMKDAEKAVLFFVLHACAIKSEQLHKRSLLPLPTTTHTQVSLSSPSRSSELSNPVTLKPLSQSVEAWRALPGISEWVMNTVVSGCTLQFAQRPPRFNGVVMLEAQNTPVLKTEIHISPRERGHGDCTC